MSGKRKMSMAMTRAVNKSMAMTREMENQRQAINPDARGNESRQQHGTHKIRLSNIDKADTDSQVVYIPSRNINLKTFLQQVQETFEFEREALVYLIPVLYDDSTILSIEEIIDIVEKARKRKDGCYRIQTSDELVRIIKVWEENAMRRRKKVVDELMNHAFQKVKTGKPAEKLLGLDQVFELTSLPANLSSLNEEDLEILVRVVNDSNQYLSIRNKAALVCWQLENILHGRFGAALVKRQVDVKAIATLKEALSHTDEEGSVQTSEASAHGDDETFDDPAVAYTTCTKTDLGGVFPLAGALVSMIDVPVVKERLVRPENLRLLLDIAALNDPLAAKCGADGIAILLASKWAARVELVRIGGLLRLKDNLQSSATEVNLSSAASINCIVRDSNGRHLVPPEHAAQCFLTLIELSKWCREELMRTAELDKSGEKHYTFGRNEKLVPTMLEHTAAAIWGCAACISESKQFQLLESTVESWVPQLAALCNFSSDSVHDSVVNGANCAMALLTAGLADTIAYHFEKLVHDNLKIVEGGEKEDGVTFQVLFEGMKKKKFIEVKDKFMERIANVLQVEVDRIQLPQLSNRTTKVQGALGGVRKREDTVAFLRIAVTLEDRKIPRSLTAYDIAAKLEAAVEAAKIKAAIILQQNAEAQLKSLSISEDGEEDESIAMKRLLPESGNREESKLEAREKAETVTDTENVDQSAVFLDSEVFGEFTVRNIEPVLHEPVPLKAREAASATLCAMAMTGSGTLDRYRGQIDEAMRDKGSAIVDGIVADNGIERCAAIVEESVEMEGSTLLEKQLSATIMYLCGIPGRRSRKLLETVVGLLGSTNRYVVQYMVMAIWLLAHDDENKKLLGDLWAVDGLVKVAKANSNIKLKEYIVSALWILSTKTADGEGKNAIRVAMRGGLQYIVAMVNFDFDESGVYLTLVTLSIGILFELASQNEDIQNLIEQMSIADALLRCVSHPFSSPYLRVLAGGLIFRLTRRSDYLLNELKEQRGRWVLEDIYSSMLCSDDAKLRVVGLFCMTSLSMDMKSKVAFGKRNCVEGIVKIMKNPKITEDIFTRCLHGLLNLSTHTDNQSEICRRALKILLRIADSPHSQTQIEFATSILANLSNNVICRKLMYKFQLQHTSRALALAQPMNLDFTPSLSVQPVDEEEKVSETQIRNDFLGWFTSNFLSNRNDNDTVVDDFEALQFDDNETAFSSIGEGTAFNSNRAFTPGRVRPRSSPTQSKLNISAGASRGNGPGSIVSAGRISHTSAYDRDITVEQISTVQRWIRTPVQALWEENLSSQKVPPSPGLGKSSQSHASSSRLSNSSKTRLPANVNTSGRTGVRPLSPKRSSHRIGPVGSLGSTTTLAGQNRWEPRVLSYNQPHAEETEDDGRAQGRGKSSTHRPPTSQMDANGNLIAVTDLSRIREVQLEPSTAYNKITFGGEKKISHYNPVTMWKWKRVPGATVYSSLFRYFEGSNGEQSYFYHSSEIVCEALDPGPYPYPQKPLFLEQILQTDMPNPPSRKVPNGNTQHPAVFFPAIPKCPQICKHAVPKCILAGNFGGVSADPVPFFVREIAPVPIDESEAPRSPDAPRWDVNDSIFEARKREADSKAVYDRVNNKSVVAQAMNRDWKRLTNENRFHKFVFKNDDDVKGDGQALDEELKETREVFKKFYSQILWIFDYYCAVGTTLGRTAYSMQMNSYAKFIQDCKIPDENVSVEDCTKIFIVVNYEEDKKSYQSEVNEDKALMRHELCESLVRIAVQKYSKINPDVSECLELLMEHIVVNIPKEAIIDPDDFRENRFYSEDMERALKKYMKDMKAVYNYYSTLNPVQGKARYGIDEIVQMFQDAGMLGNHVSSREARLAFFQSRMVVKDEVGSRLKFTTLSCWEFVEAMARLADCTSLPTDNDLEKVSADSIMDFELKLTKLVDPEKKAELKQRRNSIGMLSPKTRPMDEKIQKFICMLMGRLGIHFKGRLKNSLSFVPKYISQEQLKELQI